MGIAISTPKEIIERRPDGTYRRSRKAKVVRSIIDRMNESTATLVSRQTAWADHCTLCEIKSLVDDLINATTPPLSDALAPLLERQTFGMVSAVLCNEFSGDNLLTVLLSPPHASLRAFGMARHFDILPVRSEAKLFTIGDLRNSNHPEAAVALAALGEIDWPLASRRARQAFLINQVAKAWRST